MSHNIKFLSLQKFELEYEIAVRGGTPADNVSELRKQIVKLSQSLPSEDILESHLDATDDLRAVKESLIKSQSNLIALNSKFDNNLFLRTENLLHHIFHRLNRINSTNVDIKDALKATNKCYMTQYNELNRLNIKTNVSAPTNLPEKASDIASTNIAVTCDRGLSSDLSKLKYNGKTCVRSFIQRVNEFITARGINPDKILSYSTEIFIDDAIHWYRSIKHLVQSWSELAILLKQDFDFYDYDYRLMSEIRSRTQGENESITIYFAIMHGMFSRLSKIVPENEQLEVLLHNIRPCYASTLASCSNITTIEFLRNQCRKYEHFQSRLAFFREPPKVTPSTLAPEFAYNQQTPGTSQSANISKNSYYNSKYNYTPRNSNSNFNSKPVYPINSSENSTNNNYTNNSCNTNTINSNDNFNSNLNSVVTQDTTPVMYISCRRCRTNDHTLKQCKKPRVPVCFKCGKFNVTYPNCPDCIRPLNYPNHKLSKN